MGATVKITGDNKGVKDSVKDTEQLLNGFGRTAMAVGATIVSALAVRQAFSWASDFISAAMESEAAENVLASALRATGEAAGFNTKQLVGLAEELQDITKFEAEVTEQAMAILSTFRNVRGENFVEATKAAQDLATVFGGDLSGKAMMLGKALNDPLEGLSALTRMGVTFSEAQKKVIESLINTGDVAGAQKVILEEVKNQVGGAAEAAGETASGRMEQMKHRLGDMAENIGFALLKVIDSLMPFIESGVNFVENFSNIVVETITGISIMLADSQSGLSQFIEWLVDAAVTIYTAFDFLANNLDKVWSYVLVSMESTFETVVQVTKHAFTEAVPTYFNYMMKLVQTGFSTMLENATSYRQGFAAILRGNIDEAMQHFNSIIPRVTGAWSKALAEIPGFPERSLSDKEKELQQQAEKLYSQLQDQFGAEYNINKKDFLEMFKSKNKERDELWDHASQFYGDLSKHDGKDEKPKHHKDDEDKKEKEQKAEFVGLEEFGKKLQLAALGKGGDDIEKIKIEALDDATKHIDDAANEFTDGALTLEHAVEHLDNAIDSGLDDMLKSIDLESGKKDLADALGEMGDIVPEIQDELNAEANRLNEPDQSMERQNSLLADTKDLLADIKTVMGDQRDSLISVDEQISNVGAMR
jgi:hypothetical protein